MSIIQHANKTRRWRIRNDKSNVWWNNKNDSSETHQVGIHCSENGRARYHVTGIIWQSILASHTAWQKKTMDKVVNHSKRSASLVSGLSFAPINNMTEPIIRLMPRKTGVIVPSSDQPSKILLLQFFVAQTVQAFVSWVQYWVNLYSSIKLQYKLKHIFAKNSKNICYKKVGEVPLVGVPSKKAILPVNCVTKNNSM